MIKHEKYSMRNCATSHYLDDHSSIYIPSMQSKNVGNLFKVIGPTEKVVLGLAEEYYVNHTMADEVSSLRHQIEGDNHGQNNG